MNEIPKTLSEPVASLAPINPAGATVAAKVHQIIKSRHWGGRFPPTGAFRAYVSLCKAHVDYIEQAPVIVLAAEATLRPR